MEAKGHSFFSGLPDGEFTRKDLSRSRSTDNFITEYIASGILYRVRYGVYTKTPTATFNHITMLKLLPDEFKMADVFKVLEPYKFCKKTAYNYVMDAIRYGFINRRSSNRMFKTIKAQKL